MRAAREDIGAGRSSVAFAGLVERQESAHGVVREERAREEGVRYPLAQLGNLPLGNVRDRGVREERIAPFERGKILEVLDLVGYLGAHGAWWHR